MPAAVASPHTLPPPCVQGASAALFEVAPQQPLSQLAVVQPVGSAHCDAVVHVTPPSHAAPDELLDDALVAPPVPPVPPAPPVIAPPVPPVPPPLDAALLLDDAAVLLEDAALLLDDDPPVPPVPMGLPPSSPMRS
jgi:hypothetical protein